MKAVIFFFIIFFLNLPFFFFKPVNCVSDTRKYMLEVKELAVSANTSAVMGLRHFGDFSQKLLNTSSTLSRVNHTLRKTSELITHTSKAGMFAASVLFRNVTACRSSTNIKF